MNKFRYWVIVVCTALAITISSIAVAKLGEPYYCSQEQKYPELRRDERGIPFTYVKRSVQGTGCSPKNLDDRLLTYEEQYRSVHYLSFMLNIGFWTVTLSIFIPIFKKLGKNK